MDSRGRSGFTLQLSYQLKFRSVGDLVSGWLAVCSNFHRGGLSKMHCRCDYLHKFQKEREHEKASLEKPAT